MTTLIGISKYVDSIKTNNAIAKYFTSFQNKSLIFPLKYPNKVSHICPSDGKGSGERVNYDEEFYSWKNCMSNLFRHAH